MWDDGFWFVEYFNTEYWGEDVPSGPSPEVDQRLTVRYKRLGPLNVKIYVERT